MTNEARYFEDLNVGDTFQSPSLEVEREAIFDFAQKFDPQPFHLSEEGAEGSIFKSLAASGWHTAALSMRLLLASDINVAGGIIGQSVDELKWLWPVRPGDHLHNRIEVIGKHDPKPASKAGRIQLHVDVLNQDEKVVQAWKSTISVPKDVHK